MSPTTEDAARERFNRIVEIADDYHNHTHAAAHAMMAEIKAEATAGLAAFACFPRPEPVPAGVEAAAKEIKER